MFDLALQELGSVKAVFELAFANGISITENLHPGQTLDIPEKLIPSMPSNGNETVRYIVDDAYLWYLKQFAPTTGNGGTDVNLDHVVKYTPQDPNETQQSSARKNLGITDEPIPNWSQKFQDLLSF